MSHQDTEHVTTNAENLQEALDWLLPKGTFADIEFRDQSVWNPLTLIFTALMWCWSGKPTLTKRFAEARKIMARNAPEDEQPGKSYTGFLKRLVHWSQALRNRVIAEFRRTMQEEMMEHFLVGDWLVMAGDGSRTATPRTKSNEARFAAKKKAKKKAKPTSHQKRLQNAKQRKQKQQKQQTEEARAKKASTPQIWLTVLYHVGLGLPYDWRTGPSDSSEREHLLDMAKNLPDKSLITLDAGFVGYDFWQTLDQAGVAFVARVGSNVRLLKNLGCVRRQQDIVYVWPDAARKKQQPPLMLRLHAFSGAKEEVYLVTNVIEKNRLSAAQMRDIYQARWGVETYYRDLKQTFERAKMLSKTADNAQLELDWSIIGLWAICLYGTAQHLANGIPPRWRSVANLLHAFRLSMEQAKCEPDPGEDIFSLIAIAFKDDYKRKSSKASRNHPCKKKKHKIGKPIFLEATKEQQTAANNLKTAA
jgi:Transposase DDE domain